MMQLVDLNVPVDPLKWRGACRSWGTSESALSRRIIALLEATRCPLLILFGELLTLCAPKFVLTDGATLNLQGLYGLRL